MMNRVFSILASLLISAAVVSDAFFLSPSEEADYERLIQRQLEENNNYGDDNNFNNEYFEYDLNDFSLRCTYTHPKKYGLVSTILLSRSTLEYCMISQQYKYDYFLFLL